MDGTARVWDASTSTAHDIATLKGPQASVNSVAFNPDGQRLATGSVDGIVRLWDVRSGQTVSELKDNQGPVNSVAFSPDRSPTEKLRQLCRWRELQG